MASSKGIAILVLVLRIITLLLLVGCVVVIVTNNYKLSDGQKQLFQSVQAYRYVLATASIGAAYTLLQIPLAIYYVCTEKRLIRDGILVPFDFYTDKVEKVIAFLLATGVGAGFAVSIESKNFVNEINDILLLLPVPDLEDWRSKTLHFFDRGNIATVILLAGFISMAFVSILTSINLSAKSSGQQGYFFR